MFLETERLLLRKFREEDFEDFYVYAADQEMSRMMGRDDLSDREAVRAVIDELFRVEGMDYVECGYFDFNLPSERLQEKLGFVRLMTGTINRKGEEIHTVDNVLWRT